MYRAAGQRQFYTFDLKKQIIRGYFYLDGKRRLKKICDFWAVGLVVSDFDQNRKLKKTDIEKDKLNAKIMGFYLEVAKAVEKTARKIPRRIKPLFQEWIDLSAARRSEKTVKGQYIPASNDYIKLVGDHDLSQFSVRMIDKLTIGLKARGLRPVSINSKIRTVRTFINWVAEREVDFRPKVKWARCFLDEVKKVPGVLSADEIKQLALRLDHLVKNGRNSTWRRYYLCHQRYMFMAAGTGCRLSEIFYLPWENIDLEVGAIKVSQSAQFTPKPKRESVRFLPPYLVAYLKTQADDKETWYLDNGKGQLAYKNPMAITTAFSRHFKELGIKGVKATHGFRAGFATLLRNEHGADLKTIQDMMGLSNIKVLDHYFSKPERPMIEAAGKIDPFSA
jgi:integrase